MPCILISDRDWAYTIAYNAVLQEGRALMFAHGYRPDGANQQISVVKFAELYLEKMMRLYSTGCDANNIIQCMILREQSLKQKLNSPWSRLIF